VLHQENQEKPTERVEKPMESLVKPMESPKEQGSQQMPASPPMQVPLNKHM
jgi:hypothetical protein